MKFIANIWPIAVADGYTDTIIKELEKEGTILSVHKIDLNYTGLRNYMIQIYRHEKWSGNFHNHFRGIPAKLNPCFYPDTPMYLIELEGKSVESMLACKERIRKLCKHEKHSLHTSDTEAEYLLMKKILLHQPTVACMNTTDFDKYKNFTHKFGLFLKLLDFYQLDYEDFLVVSRGVYSLTGIRKENRLSWICKVPKQLPRLLSRLNNREFTGIPDPSCEEIYNPDNHISYCGIDFLTPNIIQKLEQNQ